MIPYSDPDKFGVIIFLIWCGLWIGLSIIIPFIENKKNKGKYMNNNDKKEIINLIDDWNAISFYELNEHSKECYYDIRNAILAMPTDASQEYCEGAVNKQVAPEIIKNLYPNMRAVEMKKMTFEEIKEMFKKSIDTTDTMNQAIENLIQSIYLKGYNDALNHAHCPNCGAKMVEPHEESEE